MKTSIIGKIIPMSVKEVTLNVPRTVFYKDKICKLGDYDPNSDLFTVIDCETNEEHFADINEMKLFLFQTEVKTSNGIIENQYNINKEILLNIDSYPLNNNIVLLFDPIKMEVTKFRKIDIFNKLEILKLLISLSMMFWAVIGYYNLYNSLKEIILKSSNEVSFKFLWTYGAVQQSSGTNPRMIFYGILIFASVYLLSKIKSLKIKDINLNNVI